MPKAQGQEQDYPQHIEAKLGLKKTYADQLTKMWHSFKKNIIPQLLGSEADTNKEYSNISYIIIGIPFASASGT